jgi:hypothetical protein
MTLYSRDVFTWEGARWRVLQPATARRNAVIINIHDRNAWPLEIGTDKLSQCEREVNAERPVALTPSPACAKKLEGDWARLQPVIHAQVDLFDNLQRQRCLAHVAHTTGRCLRTLETHLRRYWQRGMTKSALLPDYCECGRPADGNTGGRGRRPRAGEVYQVTEEDVPRMQAAIKHYFEEKRLSLTNAWQWLLENYYVYEDNDGNKRLLSSGETPSYRQFAYFLKRNHPQEKRLRKRHGEKEFKRSHKANLSDTIADCLGVGHTYEIDATIADVLIVHSTNREKIIGKATVYFIVDRKTRLIPSFYIGLEYPCWETAVEALICLVESKEDLCARYGVAYDPRDWPADGLLPAMMLGDHAEMISKYSTALPDKLDVEVANPESRQPNHKPNVETKFKFKTQHLRAIAPGYVPPEDFGKRQTKKYDKEACLTLRELGKLVLEAIIRNVRSPITTYPRSADEILRNVEPSPIALWKDGVEQSGCMARRFDEATVRAALLPRATAQFTNDGLLFNDLYFASDDPRFIRACIATKKHRSSVTVSYDRRSVDCIYVHFPDTPAAPALARLSDRNHGFSGLSFREAAIVRDIEAGQKPGHETTRRQVAFESTERSRPTIRNAERARDEFGPLSANARNAETVTARAAQKRQENIARADRQSDQKTAMAGTAAPPATNVVGLPVTNRTSPTQSSPPSAAQLVRERMR